MIRRPPRATLFPSPTLFRSPRSTRRRPPPCSTAVTPQRRSPAAATRTEPSHAPRPRLPWRSEEHTSDSHANISYAVFCLKKKKSTRILKEAHHDRDPVLIET